MFVIPFRISAREYSMYIVLDDENLERIKKYDPAEVTLRSMGGEWARSTLKDVIIAYATSAEQQQVLELCATGKVKDALRLLSRGFRYRPDQGDYDGPYLSAKTKPGEKPQ
jgi:hypothetical protein